MRFRVNLYEDERLVGTEVTDDWPLFLAKNYAAKAVQDGRADRAEIRRLDGSFVFRAISRAGARKVNS